MQYEPQLEKVAMTHCGLAPNGRVLPLAEDPEIQRTRKVLVIMLIVVLVSLHRFRNKFLTFVEKSYRGGRPLFPGNAEKFAPF